jgi:SNW domain-containing protein 1
MNPQYIRYKPNSNSPGQNLNIPERVIKIVDQQIDPLAPSKFRNKKAPPPPGSPPAPVLRSPPKKLTREDQQIWKIPPCISNWKNAKGYVVPLDKRVGADGRGLQDVTVSDRFVSLAEDLYVAERKAREEIKIRNDLTKQQKARAEEQREQELRELAQQARMARATGSKSEEASIHERARKEVMRETLREHRMAKAGRNARDRDEGRDISEAVALGKQVQPTVKGGESMYDARLFNQDSDLSMREGGEDINAYDSRLFADRSSAAGYKYDAQRVGAARQEMEDQEHLSRERKRPTLGRNDSSVGATRRSLEFVTEDGDEEDDPFRIGDLLGKKPKH